MRKSQASRAAAHRGRGGRLERGEHLAAKLTPEDYRSLSRIDERENALPVSDRDGRRWLFSQGSDQVIAGLLFGLEPNETLRFRGGFTYAEVLRWDAPTIEELRRAFKLKSTSREVRAAAASAPRLSPAEGRFLQKLKGGGVIASPGDYASGARWSVDYFSARDALEAAWARWEARIVEHDDERGDDDD